jgi:hypothetical protein
MTRVRVVPSGPPRVISQISSNRRSDQMVMSSATSPTVGLMTCQVTTRKTHQRLAPSISAASVSSAGTDCSADRSTTATNGKSCQMVVARIAVRARSGLSRMPLSPMSTPSPRSTRLTMPYWALSIQVAMSAVAIPGAAHGTVTRARAMPRPGNRPFSSNATPRPEPTAPTTHATT